MRRNVHQERVRYPNAVTRSLLFALLSSVAVMTAAPAAYAGPTPTAAAALVAPDRAHDGGVVAGTVTGIDYVRGIMSMRADKRGPMDVYVLPSTNIQGKSSGYFTITDLKKGSNVEVFTSVVGTRTNAQIIKLK